MLPNNASSSGDHTKGFHVLYACMYIVYLHVHNVYLHQTYACLCLDTHIYFPQHIYFTNYADYIPT